MYIITFIFYLNTELVEDSTNEDSETLSTFFLEIGKMVNGCRKYLESLDLPQHRQIPIFINKYFHKASTI